MPIVLSPALAMTGVVILDPAAVATGRTALSLNDAPGGAIRLDKQGIDWGDAAIQAYMADARWGSSPVDFRVPNRTVKIPLFVGANDGGQAAFDSAYQQLRQKVALFQREGGWLQRGSDVPMYADVVNATLTFPDVWGEYAGLEPNVALQLECLPDFYGDEITLDTIAATGTAVSKLKLSGADAVIQGDHPARCRIIVSDTSGNDQHGLLWGLRSRHYDSAATAALTYEAEALTPVNGATVTALTGASGGNVVKLASLPAGSWVSMLSTDLLAGDPLTHAGSYRIWVRAYSASATPQLRLLWGVGSLATPVTNTAVTLPGAANFYLLDLGEIRLDAPPVGPNEWFGVIQALAAHNGDPVSIDALYLQPIEESAGSLGRNQSISASSITVTDGAATGTDNAGVGTVAWTTPANLSASDGAYAQASLGSSATSHYLEATNLGFDVPSGASILGIQLNVSRFGFDFPSFIKDNGVRLVKAGTVQATDKADTATPWTAPEPVVKSYGGSSDLWGGTWTPADINNTNFGAVISATAIGGADTALVDYVSITIYYELATGFLVAEDAVIYGSRTAELRWDGMYRTDPTGDVYGPVSLVLGDLVRLPPSGLEGRPVQVFVRPTRGDVDPLPDGGLDGLSVQVKYRPTYLFRP